MNFTDWDFDNKNVFKVEQTLESKVKYKYSKSVKQELYCKIKFLTAMKSVEGILFIKLKMKQIQLKKEIFLHLISLLTTKWTKKRPTLIWTTIRITQSPR